MSESDQKLFGIEKLNVKRSSIPAVTHVDYSARVQTVHKETNPKYHKLLKKFKDSFLSNIALPPYLITIISLIYF